MSAMRSAETHGKYQVKFLTDGKKLEKVITDELLARYKEFLTSKHNEERLLRRSMIDRDNKEIDSRLKMTRSRLKAYRNQKVGANPTNEAK